MHECSLFFSLLLLRTIILASYSYSSLEYCRHNFRINYFWIHILLEVVCGFSVEKNAVSDVQRERDFDAICFDKYTPFFNGKTPICKNCGNTVETNVDHLFLTKYFACSFICSKKMP